MITLAALDQALQGYLRITDTEDYSGAYNGLQLENRTQKVTKVAVAVDASLPVMKKAVAQGADLLLTHHGMFWNSVLPICGANYKKLSYAMEAGLAVYAVHLPLDSHAEVGNNVLLAKALGMQVTEAEWCLPYKGKPIALRVTGVWQRQEILQKLEKAVGGKVQLCSGGEEEVRDVVICTGGAGSEVAAVAKLGADTLITGEGPHWSYPLAEELGINVFYAGHYATETFGVKALGQWLEEKFGLDWCFVDHPTGL
jgi:dinuclear metal center YbgI/SA1388 family protein